MRIVKTVGRFVIIATCIFIVESLCVLTGINPVVRHAICLTEGFVIGSLLRR